MSIDYILEKKENINILLNKDIIKLMNEYNEFEANKFKSKTLLIIIENDDIITLKSKELLNDYYQWCWTINNDKMFIQNKNMKKTNDLKPYNSIILGLEVLKKYM